MDDDLLQEKSLRMRYEIYRKNNNELRESVKQKDALIAKMQKVVDAAREAYVVGTELEDALDALDEETKG